MCRHQCGLIEHCYLVAGVNGAFYQNGSVNAGHAVVRLRDLAQHFGTWLAGIGIKRNDFAAGVALD